MQQELDCQGKIQINTATANGAGGESVSVDLPNGPSPGTVWQIDAAGALFTSDNLADSFASSICGIYIVPIASPPASAVDSIAGINLNARGVPLVYNFGNFNFSFGLTVNTYGQMTAFPGAIVPAGYTLRAIVSSSAAGGIAGNVLLTLYAQLRILQQN